MKCKLASIEECLPRRGLDASRHGNHGFRGSLRRIHKDRISSIGHRSADDLDSDLSSRR